MMFSNFAFIKETFDLVFLVFALVKQNYFYKNLWLTTKRNGVCGGTLVLLCILQRKNTQENLKPQSVETLEESFSSRSGKKDMRQETFGKEEENCKLPQKETGNGRILVYKTKEGLGAPRPPPHYLSQNFVNIFKNI